MNSATLVRKLWMYPSIFRNRYAREGPLVQAIVADAAAPDGGGWREPPLVTRLRTAGTTPGIAAPDRAVRPIASSSERSR